MEKVHQALEELKTMAAAGDPLWVCSVETGRETLNYDEYLKTFHLNNNSNLRWLKTHIEAFRETALVFMEPSRLVQSFMDEVNKQISCSTQLFMEITGSGTNTVCYDENLDIYSRD